jgi:acyl-CoA thioesterase-1
MAILGGRNGVRSWRYSDFAWIFNVALLVVVFFGAPSAAMAETPRLLLLGDSLVAGYGLPKADGFVATLDRALGAEGVKATLLDAGVSGDTTAGGRSRVAWSLGDKPTHAVVSLGANDALRGLPPEAAQANLAVILRDLKQAGLPVLLVGMRAPRNWGDEYADAFDAIYPALAAKAGVVLYPFFLEGVALDPNLNQADGIHPNAAGVRIIVNKLMPLITALLKEPPKS